MLSIMGSFLLTHLQPLMMSGIGLPMNPAVFVCRVCNTSGHAATSIWLLCNTARQGAVSVRAMCQATQQLVAARHGGCSLHAEQTALDRHLQEGDRLVIATDKGTSGPWLVNCLKLSFG